ncbi:uncharacterized protein LOC134008999 isoform X2 [Osmerus eperlanus]|uniref:uncharacterized protein LOC134008999 isoform X2 n=1 Tax=Osmerus eperlanus TaxID=29151 RepID=UPI002E106178
MSCQPMRKLITFICMIAIVSHFNLRICSSQTDLVEFAEEENATDVNGGKGKSPRVSTEDETGNFSRRNFIHCGPSLPFAKNNCSEQSERSSLLTDSAVPLRSLPAELYKTLASSPTDLPKVWKFGQAGVLKRPVDVEEGYQPEFQGLEGYVVQGKMSGSSVEADRHLSAWQAMRPSVQCKINFMTLTVTGRGYINLLVDRVDALPISLLQLPPHCGYLVKTTCEDLQLLAPYESCYITKQNGRYVLPLLWWGSPVQFSCPSPPQPAFPSIPLTVRCADFGMTIHIPGGKKAMSTPGVKVNGVWDPLVSDECAHHIDFQPEDLFLYCPFTALCLTHQNGAHLHLLIDGLEYLLSCPPLLSVPPLLPYPPFSQPLSPDPVTPGPLPIPPPSSTSDPGRLFAEHVQLLPFHHPNMGTLSPLNFIFLYPPPTPPPGTQSALPATQSTKPPPTLLDKPHHSRVSCPPNCIYPYHVPVHYPFFLSQDSDKPQPDLPTVTTPLPRATFAYAEPITIRGGPQTFPTHHVPTTASPVTQRQGPQTFPTYHVPSPVTQRQGPHTFPTYHVPSPVTQRQGPHTFPTYHVPSPVTQRQGPQTFPTHHEPSPVTQRQGPHTFPTYHVPSPVTQRQGPHTFPTYHVPSPVIQRQGPQTFPTRHEPSPVTQRQGPQTFPTRHEPSPPLPVTARLSASLQCLQEQVIAKLPYAQLDSLEVKDRSEEWTPISSTPVDCGYVVKRVASFAVTLASPLPACHSYALSPMTLTLSLRYLDVKLNKYRILELQCPNPSALDTHSLPMPATSRTVVPQPSLPAPPKFRLFCSTHHMRVELPPGPISGIVVKDVKDSKMSLTDAPKHCGYSASQLDDGRINLFLPFNSCHMTVQGEKHRIHVVYVTLNGKKRGAWLSCPVSVTVPSQECTADRHFVFSVPASFTDPPLSTGLLVAAGDDSCTPQRVSRDHAVFKIPLEGCGTHRYEVGNTVVYLLEVIHKAKLNHDSQTRDSAVRLMVECRYTPGSGSVGHLLKSPTLGPSIQTEGVFGVQLRIATDAQYTNYYPQYHRPLQMLLGKPLYLEVRVLNPPDPSVLLLVHYCVAYDRSGHSTWVLLYNGCLVSQQPVPRDHTRRFTIDTFQFLSKSKASDTDEEIYFMCSTQVCSPADGPCVEGCFSH